MRYQISYRVSIPNASKQLNISGGTVNSKIFEFSNLINKGEGIHIDFSPTEIKYSTPRLEICIHVEGAHNIIDRNGGYTRLFAEDNASDQNELESKLNTTERVFAKLK